MAPRPAVSSTSEEWRAGRLTAQRSRRNGGLRKKKDSVTPHTGTSTRGFRVRFSCLFQSHGLANSPEKLSRPHPNAEKSDALRGPLSDPQGAGARRAQGPRIGTPNRAGSPPPANRRDKQK